MEKRKHRDAETAARVKRIAEMFGISKRQVRRVISGDSSNEAVLRAYMEMAEGENLLIQEVKTIVQFNQ